MNDAGLPTVEHPWFDSSRAPLYVWTFPDRFDDRELDRALTAYRRWRQAARFESAFVVDLSHIRAATTRQRLMVAGHLSESADHSRRHIVGTSLVVSTPLHRALMTAVFWMQPPPTPVHVVTNFPEGMSFCEKRLATSTPRPPTS